MTTSQKNLLFTAITEEESANVSGGDNLSVDTDNNSARSAKAGITNS